MNREEMEVVEQYISRSLAPVIEGLANLNKKFDKLEALNEKTIENRMEIKAVKERLEEHILTERNLGQKTSNQIGELYQENKGINQGISEIELRSSTEDERLKAEIITKSASAAGKSANKSSAIISTVITVLGAIIIALLK